MFEEACISEQISTAMKFQDFADRWFEKYAKLNLRNTSYERMNQLAVRIYPAIGHLRLDKITSRHIQQFINDLALNGKSLKNGKPLLRKTVVHHLCFISDVSSYAVKYDRLFVKWNGEPMNNQTPYGWLKEFCEKNDKPFYGIHSFRHFAASALISAGLDVTTVSGALGHCNSGTTLNVYSHMFQNAQARVAQAMDGAFSFLPQDSTT